MVAAPPPPGRLSALAQAPRIRRRDGRPWPSTVPPWRSRKEICSPDAVPERSTGPAGAAGTRPSNSSGARARLDRRAPARKPAGAALMAVGAAVEVDPERPIRRDVQLPTARRRTDPRRSAEAVGADPRRNIEAHAPLPLGPLVRGAKQPLGADGSPAAAATARRRPAPDRGRRPGASASARPGAADDDGHEQSPQPPRRAPPAALARPALSAGGVTAPTARDRPQLPLHRPRSSTSRRRARWYASRAASSWPSARWTSPRCSWIVPSFGIRWRGLDELVERLLVLPLSIEDPAHRVEVGGIARVERERPLTRLCASSRLTPRVGEHVAEIVERQVEVGVLVDQLAEGAVASSVLPRTLERRAEQELRLGVLGCRRRPARAAPRPPGRSGGRSGRPRRAAAAAPVAAATAAGPPPPAGRAPSRRAPRPSGRSPAARRLRCARAPAAPASVPEPLLCLRFGERGRSAHRRLLRVLQWLDRLQHLAPALGVDEHLGQLELDLLGVVDVTRPAAARGEVGEDLAPSSTSPCSTRSCASGTATSTSPGSSLRNAVSSLRRPRRAAPGRAGGERATDADVARSPWPPADP